METTVERRIRLRDGRWLAGVGRSDPDPGRITLSWASDVEELLDRLGVDRFAVMGWSMGGQYAAAIGRALRHSVTRVAIVAGALPLTGSGVFAQLPAMDRYLTRMSERAPWLARQWFRILGLARQAPRITNLERDLEHS